MGRFGTLLAKIIKGHFPAEELVETVEEADIVVPAVPISAFEDVIKEISPKLKPGALVLDVCSVKVHPVNIMKKYLPKNVEIIATHPLFGPDSAKASVKGLKIMLHNVSANKAKYEKLKAACKQLGLNIVEITPEEHDKAMAYSQAYTHFVGRIGQELGLRETPIDTEGFKQTLKIQQYVINDTEKLFIDMHKFNPYAKAMREKFLSAATKLDKRINFG